MAQLMMNADILDTPSLREHIESKVEEIETILPEGSPLIIHIKRVSKRLFGAHFRARVLGREVVVGATDQNLFRAVNRARRGLLRQIDDVKSLTRDEVRQRR